MLARRDLSSQGSPPSGKSDAFRVSALTLGIEPSVDCTSVTEILRPRSALADRHRAFALSVPLNILDLVSIREGSTARNAIAESMASAKLADELGYKRLWFAEHHNTMGLAASATALLISRAASVTEKIRVGSGGVMLPNHAHSRSPNSTERSRTSTVAASIWASAAHPARTG